MRSRGHVRLMACIFPGGMCVQYSNKHLTDVRFTSTGRFSPDQTRRGIESKRTDTHRICNSILQLMTATILKSEPQIQSNEHRTCRVSHWYTNYRAEFDQSKQISQRYNLFMDQEFNARIKLNYMHKNKV